MNKTEKIYKENLNYAILFIGVTAIVSKLIEHFYLPGKYYYDNYRIFYTVNDPEYSGRWGGSYEVAANFFRKINVFHFTTFLQWSIFLGIIFNISLMILFSKNRGLDLKQTIFAVLYTGILNIYIFNVGKDAIQLLFFIMLFVIINSNISKIVKVTGCFLILYWESTFYRNYYIIIAFFFLSIVLGTYFLRKRKRRVGALKVVFIIFLLYALVYIFLYIAQTFMPTDYQGIMTCKEGVKIMDANSSIYDKIDHNGNLLLYIQNYMINSIRMAFPVELLMKGIYYLPFVLFEIFLLYYLGKAVLRLYKMDFKQVLALSIFIAYFMGSVLFEPDFGSFVRHEAATFPVLYILIFNRDNWRVQGANNDREGVKTINERINQS